MQIINGSVEAGFDRDAEELQFQRAPKGTDLGGKAEHSERRTGKIKTKRAKKQPIC